ncbi:hypothetical protein ACOSQ3_022842 [Xanthoceras sorbifolium]
MDVEDIARLCASLSLTDAAGLIVQIEGEIHREGAREVSQCLVGKVLAQKRINKDAFKGVIEQILVGMVCTVVEISTDSKDCGGKFLRVKVQVDISKPFLRGLKVKLEEFDMLVVAIIKYERLLEFCFGCGHLGHSLRDCENEAARDEALEGSATKYG